MILPGTGASTTYIMPSNTAYQGASGLGVTQYTTGRSVVTTRDLPINPNLVAGPGSIAAERAKQAIAARNRRGREVDPWAQPQNRPAPIGPNQKSRAMSYYFEGQFGATQGLKSQFSIDPNAIYTGQLSPDIIQREMRHNDWRQASPQLTNIPPNFYLGFGHQIKFAGTSLIGKQKARHLTELMQFGGLGSLSRDTAMGQMGAFLKRTQKERAQALARERAAMIPMKHTRPDTEGEYQLGNMQGQRLRAWERRQLQKQEELEKKRLKAAGPGERRQQEATKVERASTR